MAAHGVSWCVQVDVDLDEVDEASGVLWAAGVTSVHEIDLDDGRRRLVAGTSETGADRVRSALGRRWPNDSYAADYDGWLDAWRPYARPVRVGRVVVFPAWDLPPTESASSIAVAIDAQHAFGQGNHPTTRLMLAEIDRVLRRRDTVLDVGCGSGVLGITAAALGAAHVVAVDIDADAVTATRANAERNGLADRLVVSSANLGQTAGPFDLVLANILTPVLVELAVVIVEQVAEGGTLIVSGLLDDQRDEVRDAYPGWSAINESTLDGWGALTLRR